MILSFDRALTRMEIWANGAELATIMGMDRDEQGRRVHDYPRHRAVKVAEIDSPVLVTDVHRVAELGAEDPVLRDTVMALYGTKSRITRYDGTELDFVQARFPGVWGPSIDTLLFCRAMAKMDLSGVRDVIEIGAGSGFITKWLLEHHEGIERAELVDMMSGAIEVCGEVIGDPRARFHVGDGLAFLAQSRADLVWSNPPYIPRPRSIDDNPYEGVSLLVEMILRARDYLTEGGALLLNLSSLCRDIADRAVAQAGLELEVIDRMEVPLKVYNVLNNEEWLNFLVEEKGMTPSRRAGYDYWHTIEVVALRAP